MSEKKWSAIDGMKLGLRFKAPILKPGDKVVWTPNEKWKDRYYFTPKTLEEGTVLKDPEPDGTVVAVFPSVKGRYFHPVEQMSLLARGRVLKPGDKVVWVPNKQWEKENYSRGLYNIPEKGEVGEVVRAPINKEAGMIDVRFPSLSNEDWFPVDCCVLESEYKPSPAPPKNTDNRVCHLCQGPTRGVFSEFSGARFCPKCEE